MALKFFLDAGCTIQMFAAQVFSGTGSATSFTLSNFIGAALGSVYLETQVTTTGVTFDSGVGSGFSGLTANALVGRRVIHNGTFRGTVISNTTDEVTISDSGYTRAVAGTAIISSFQKLVNGTTYSVTGDVVSLIGVTPTTAQKVHCLPTNQLGLNFGGTTGASKTTAGAFWVQAEAGYTYDTLMLASVDNSQAQASHTQAGVTFDGGVGSGFSGLVAGALIGRALTHGGIFRGIITDNDTTSVTIDDTGYTEAVAAEAVCFTIGSLQFALDSGGSPGAFAPVVHPADINTTEPVKLHVEDTVVVPGSAMNYPNLSFTLSGIEYLL